MRAVRALGGALLLVACKKPSPPPAASSVPSSRAAVALATSGAAALASSAPQPSTPPPARQPEPKPTLLDAEGQRVAKAYLTALARGRKATIAKDYALADAQFSQCLELLPGDPRALSERGYARLLADKLAEARADFLAAKDKAPNAALAQQVVYNLMLTAQKSGDEAQAAHWKTERQRLKASRRLPGGVECNISIGTDELEPTLVPSVDAALQVFVQAHAKGDGTDASNIEHTSPLNDERYQAELSALKAQQPLADGVHVLWTSGGSRINNHGLIARAGKLYVFPSLSAGQIPLCGFEDLAEVTIEGGDATPWRIRRDYRSLVRGYFCQQADGSLGPDCGEDAQTMGFCSWSESRTEVSILDAENFRGVLRISVAASPSGEKPASEPQPLLELDWHPDHVVVEACGQRQKVPYVEP